MKNTSSIKKSIPVANEKDFVSWGGAHEFLMDYSSNPTLQTNPKLKQLHESLVEHSSVCSFCGVGCPFTVIQGKTGKEKLTPLSQLGLCVKGETSLLTGGISQRSEKLKHRSLPDDRIQVPMIRGHDGKWQEVSWEKALDRAAWLFLHIREWIGPEGIAIYGNGQKTIEAIWMASLYQLVFSIPTIGANSEHCLASAGAAHTLNFGNEASFTWKEFEELELCDVVIIHGANPRITFPQAHKKLKRNTKSVKVVIDPIESDTVLDLRQEDPKTIHIRFEQGGDVLFNLAVAQVILKNKWENRSYLEQVVEAESLRELEALCLQDRFTPEHVAKQIVLEEDEPATLAKIIRDYAALIARPRPDGYRPRPAFISSMGINQSTGAYGFSTNLNLLLLTGNVGRRGAGSLRIAGQSNAPSELSLGFNSRRLVFNLDPANKKHRSELAEVLNIPEHNIPDSPGTPVSQMSDDDFLYCFIFMGTQFSKNMPRLGRWLRRLGRSFSIVIDSILPDGALEHADVILPAFSYTERNGVIQRGDRTLQLQQRITEPPSQAWSDEQVLARLALAIAKRLEDPDTAALNNLDPEVINRTFKRYLDHQGTINSAKVFDHLVSVSCQLGVYNRLVDDQGHLISHEMLRNQAGRGVQWQGNGRYSQSQTEGNIFPGLRQKDQSKACLVCPPERFLEKLVTRGNEKLRSLITGRGRPGMNPSRYVARYNSGLKTRSITKVPDDTYWIELHPTYAARVDLNEGDPVRITSHHGTIVGCVSLNPHVAIEFPFLDFVPGEANRLTNYLDSDRFTNQSLIKRTPVRIERLTPPEMILWKQPEQQSFEEILSVIIARFEEVYPTDEAAACFSREEPEAPDWLPLELLNNPTSGSQKKLAMAVGAFATFLQRFSNDLAYRSLTVTMFQKLNEAKRDGLLKILLPLLRKLDYDTLLLPILSEIVGTTLIKKASGEVFQANLEDSHKNAVIELKEEVVAIQIYAAIKQALELLYHSVPHIPQEDLALITGIRIPCASDVPSYFLGVSPSELGIGRLIHCHAIGRYSIVVVDRKHNRAVKMDISTGVLPKDRELLMLRGKVIMTKRSADRDQHRRFFDRLPELIVNFIRVGRKNFRVTGPVSFPWKEFSDKLAFVPAGRTYFRNYLMYSNLSKDLIQGLVDLEMLNSQEDADFIQRLMKNDDLDQQKRRRNSNNKLQTFSELVTTPSLSTTEKVQEVMRRFIEPVILNDGGKIDLLNFDEEAGDVTIRFSGSCANCPASMLSVETLVKPPLFSIPGVNRVEHRGYLRPNEMPTSDKIKL